MINSMPIGELKTNFSAVLDMIRKGNQVNILFGKKKIPIAVILPYNQVVGQKRKLGLANKSVKISFAEDFPMTEEELLK